VKRSRHVTCYISPLGFRKSGIVGTVVILALLEGVFQTKALELSLTYSCKRLLSKVCANDEQNLPIGLQATVLP
jgi:hypothetical protein